jgi:hydroxypyruvate isomerase
MNHTNINDDNNATTTNPISRRGLMASAAGGAAALSLGGTVLAQQGATDAKAVGEGRLPQSVCKWCFKNMSVEELAQLCNKIGLKGIDLVGPDAFPTLKKYNLVSTMTNSPQVRIEQGLNRKENWEKILSALRGLIDANAAEGFPNVICFSGNRGGMPDDEGLKNCAEALKQIVGHSEQKKVTICMELLNSKQHKDYMCDHTAWGVELCKAVGSERFKLLYDIYHMQIMEGDVIATIRANKDYLAHYHTAGVPGRNELDENQELQYTAIMRAIADTGFKGYVAQEFIPKRDPATSLAEAARVCTV